MIPLSLFSSELSYNEKEKVAEKLLLHELPKPLMCLLTCYSAGFGKSSFPTHLRALTTLSDLVTDESWFFFKIIQLDSTFLLGSAANRSSVNSYQRGLQNVDALNVVNGYAECSVKQCADFFPCAESEEHFQNVLQVVENDCRKITDIYKSFS